MPFIKVYIHFVWATKNFENILDKNVRYKLFDHIYKDATLKGIKVKINQINFIDNTVNEQELKKQMKGTRSNEEFLMSMNK